MDYTAVSPTVIIFGEDESFLPVAVAITDNDVVEYVEEFVVGVRVVGGDTAVRLRNSTAVVSIVDDDGELFVN